LTSRVVLGGSDERLFKLIRDGVPGAGMPPQQISDEQVWQVAAYLQSLVRPGMQAPVAGDARRGEGIFDSASCRSCHMIEGMGGFLGPDLSDAALRLTADEMRRAVVDPSAEARDGFRALTLVTSRGERVTGLLRNESNFSIQVQRRDGSYFSASRDALPAMEFEPASLMPSDYSRCLSPEELQDLLAYLDQRRAPGRSAAVWLVKPH
jgi:putative heme-binding domain-containing protein